LELLVRWEHIVGEGCVWTVHDLKKLGDAIRALGGQSEHTSASTTGSTKP
jgi:hypothetical protein